MTVANLTASSSSSLGTVSAGNISAASITGSSLRSNGGITAGGDITAFTSSDIKLKENVQRIPAALTKVNSLTGNTFTWKENPNGHEGDDTGVIAQEVEKLGLPGVCATRPDGTKAVRYEKLVPLLIEAVRELSAKVEELESK